MKKSIILISIIIVLWCGGCGSGSATGAAAGITIGILGSETLKGAKTDLIAYEKSLQDQYAQAIAEGANPKKLERIELAIRRTQLARQGVEAGEEFLGIDWTNPEAVGTAGGGLFALLYSIYAGGKIRKKYKAHKRGTENFMRKKDDEISAELYKDIGEARKILKVPA